MYRIDIKPTITMKQFMELRKSNLKITSILWIDVGLGIYPDGETYIKRTPILMWLN